MKVLRLFRHAFPRVKIAAFASWSMHAGKLVKIELQHPVQCKRRRCRRGASPQHYWTEISLQRLQIYHFSGSLRVHFAPRKHSRVETSTFKQLFKSQVVWTEPRSTCVSGPPRTPCLRVPEMTNRVTSRLLVPSSFRLCRSFRSAFRDPLALFWFPARSLFFCLWTFFQAAFSWRSTDEQCQYPFFLKDVQRQSSFLVPFTFTLFPVFEAFFQAASFHGDRWDRSTNKCQSPFFSKMYRDSPFWYFVSRERFRGDELERSELF